MKFKAMIEIPPKRVLDTVINGLETTYWCGVEGYDYRRVEKWFEEGGTFDVYDAYEDDKPYQLTKENVQSGLQLMGEKYPSHLSDLVEEQDDAITADILLQLALFGELVYG
jgi:hypothetical protein